jgi:hypothetical protein
MSRAMAGAHRSKGTFHKFKQLLYAMAQLQTRELTLAGHVAHILAGRGEQRHPTLRQLFGLSLREMVVLSW